MPPPSQTRIALTVHVSRTNVFGRRYGDPHLLDVGGALEVVEQTSWLSFVHDPAITRVVGFTARRDDRLDLEREGLQFLDQITFDVPEHGLFSVGVSEILETLLADEEGVGRMPRPPRLPAELTDETDRASAFEALASGAFSAIEHGLVGKWMVDHGEHGSGIAHLRAGHLMSPADPWIAEELTRACLLIGDEETASLLLARTSTPQNDPWRVREWSLRDGAA